MPDAVEPVVCSTFTHGGYAKTRGHVIVECTVHGVVGSLTGEKKAERAVELGKTHERERT